MLSVHAKKGMHAIFLGNLSLNVPPTYQSQDIQPYTPTTKSRRSRSAEFMQNSERMESSLARIASLICSQRTDLICNFSILNFHLINSSCSAAVDRVRNSSFLRQEDPPVVLAQDLTANMDTHGAIDCNQFWFLHQC